LSCLSYESLRQMLTYVRYAGGVMRIGSGVGKVCLAQLVVAAVVGSASQALAQNCNLNTTGISILGGFSSGLSAPIALSAAINAANTAFLSQSTVFVAAPGEPKPGSEGGGIWVRGVGGELNLKSSANVSASLVPQTGGGPPAGTASGTCNSK